MTKSKNSENNDQTSPVTNLSRQQDFSKMLTAAGGEPRHSLKGFDPDYVDIVDYIVRSTHKIWEGKGIGLIYDHYRHNAIIHTSDGMTYGRDKVIADSLKTMAAFPDIRLFADDVIWSGNDTDGFHSSHRIVWIGRNTGHSIYGPPTGHRVVRQGIAHCFVKENRVVEEWICRDELALIRQLGLDERALAKRLVQQEIETGLNLPPLNDGEIERLQGQNTPVPVSEPTSNEFDPEYFVRRAFHEIWNWRLLNRIDDYFVPNSGAGFRLTGHCMVWVITRRMCWAGWRPSLIWSFWSIMFAGYRTRLIVFASPPDGRCKGHMMAQCLRYANRETSSYHWDHPPGS